LLRTVNQLKNWQAIKNMTNMARGLRKRACRLSQGDPLSGKDRTADFQTSCTAVSIRIARSNPAANLLGNFFLLFMQLFLITLWALKSITKIFRAHTTQAGYS
jgi:hypothetical protein